MKQTIYPWLGFSMLMAQVGAILPEGVSPKAVLEKNEAERQESAISIDSLNIPYAIEMLQPSHRKDKRGLDNNNPKAELVGPVLATQASNVQLSGSMPHLEALPSLGTEPQPEKKGFHLDPELDAHQPAAYGPSTARMAYRVRYPDYEESIRNVMDPIPLPNNPQLYPFMLTVPMEGGDVLKMKEMEVTFTQNYIDGEIHGKSTHYQVDMDQWYFEQNFTFSIGLPSNTQVGLSVPLYHFRGNNIFTQNGVEMMGTGSGSRNFWGATVLNVKHLVVESKPQQFKALLSAYFQFPEGNQRARGGTTSGHWAINSIFEKSFERERFTLNLGITQPGDLRLLNNIVLDQGYGWFVGTALSHKLSPTLALEGQLHLDQSGLQDTDLGDFNKPNLTASLGVRKQWLKSMDMSAAAFRGFDDMVQAGFTLDMRYHW